MGRDNENKVVMLPKDTNLQRANFQNKAYAEKALGVVKVKNGYAIRCTPENRAYVETQIYPTTATLIGELVALDTNNADMYFVNGVPDSIEQGTLYDALANSTLQWKCKPLYKRRGVTRFTSTWTVLVPKGQKPNRTTCTICHDNEAYHIQIGKIDKPIKTTMWDDVNSSIVNPDHNNTYESAFYWGA